MLIVYFFEIHIKNNNYLYLVPIIYVFGTNL